MTTEEFLKLAACRDADPRLFDLAWFPAAYVALAYCAVCPVRIRCLEHISPAQNFYEGVAGGMVWKDGDRLRANHRRQVIRDRKHMRELAVHPETIDNLTFALGNV